MTKFISLPLRNLPNGFEFRLNEHSSRTFVRCDFCPSRRGYFVFEVSAEINNPILHVLSGDEVVLYSSSFLRHSPYHFNDVFRKFK